VDRSDDHPASRSPEVGAVSRLRPWLERRQMIVGEAFEGFLVGSAGTATTVKTMMLIEKVGVELMGGERWRKGGPTCCSKAFRRQGAP